MVLKILLITGMLAVIYAPTFIWMWGRFFAADSYYSHGFLIPIISAFFAWSKRKELKSLPVKSSLLGLFIVIIGLLFHITGAWLRVYFISGVSFVIVLFGLVLWFFGKGVTRKLIFPLGFLVFMIPLPLVAVADISLKMKLLAAQMATWMVNHIGIRAIRDGSLITMSNSSLSVDDPCSGLKSLISLMAMGVIFGYISKTSFVKKMIIFISSIPIAVLANSVRVFLLCVISEVYGTKVATGGFFHDAGGLMVFAVAFICLMFLVNTLETAPKEE